MVLPTDLRALPGESWDCLVPGPSLKRPLQLGQATRTGGWWAPHIYSSSRIWPRPLPNAQPFLASCPACPFPPNPFSLSLLVLSSSLSLSSLLFSSPSLSPPWASFLSSSWVKNNQLSGKRQFPLSRPPHTREPLRIAFCGSPLNPSLPSSLPHSASSPPAD